MPADITMPVRLHLTMEFLLHGVTTVDGPGTNFGGVHREQSGDRTGKQHWLMHMPESPLPYLEGTAVHAQPSFDASSKSYIPGQEVVFRVTVMSANMGTM